MKNSVPSTHECINEVCSSLLVQCQAIIILWLYTVANCIALTTFEPEERIGRNNCLLRIYNLQAVTENFCLIISKCVCEMSNL
jgi:hypothetical protein